jgi:hypothetical protein
MKECQKLAVGVLLFDVLIANPDRHAMNVHLDASRKPYRMSIFDHSHALFGYENGKADERLSALKDSLGISGGTVTGQNRHCLLNAIPNDYFFSDY